MSTSTLSYERTFDDMVDRRRLLFRLHNSKSNHTFLDTERKILLASRYAPNSKEPLDPPESLDLGSLEESVEKHVTSWARKDRDPSGFISLTLNVLWVFWEWRRQVSKPYHPAEPEGFRDVFDIVILKSSELRGSAKLVTEVLKKEKCKMAYDFADSAEEVIVGECIHKAILATTQISELLEFLPSWCREQLGKVTWSSSEASDLKQKTPRSKGGLFKAFLRELKPPDDEDDCARQSLRFALVLLAPLLVPNETDIEGIVDSTAKDRIQTESMAPNIDPCGRNTMRGERELDEGKRSGSPGAGSLLEGTGGDSDNPRNVPPAKQRKVWEGQPSRRTEDAAGSTDTKSDGQAAARLSESDYVGWLAADVWCLGKWGGMRKNRESMCTDHARQLLKRYRIALESSKEDALKVLCKVVEEYEFLDTDTMKE